MPQPPNMQGIALEPVFQVLLCPSEHIYAFGVVVDVWEASRGLGVNTPGLQLAQVHSFAGHTSASE